MAKTTLNISNSEIVLTPQLLERLNAAALEMKITQSGLVALAIEEFLQRQKTRQLADDVSEAYLDAPDEEEKLQTEYMRRVQLKLLEDDEW
ncbi:MAG: hypothetical protein JNK38_10095 [Acidobacteria bacterium]|nr:hypothetical protein [Acidobacteriota bacterium]